MIPLRRFGLAALLLGISAVPLFAQSGTTGATAPVVAANATGLTGQPRGIRAVTRRTSMAIPGQEARALFTAGGVDLGGGTATVDTAPVPAPVVAEAKPEGLERPEVRRALRQLAATGDADAKRLLALPTTQSPAEATGATPASR